MMWSELDALNSNGASIKRLVGAKSDTLKSIRQSILATEEAEAENQLQLPLENDAAFESP